jgi:hypothetical protein
MHSLIAQDWVTIRGAVPGTVTQSEHQWLDLEGYENVIAWLQVEEISTPVQIAYATSPTKDDGLFALMGTPFNTYPLTAALGVTVTPLIKELCVNPLGRWFRWEIIGGGNGWDITFRLFLAANCACLKDARGGQHDHSAHR